MLVQDKFGDERIMRTSKTYWFPFDNIGRTDYVIQM